jgi:phage head maturation protease
MPRDEIFGTFCRLERWAEPALFGCERYQTFHERCAFDDFLKRLESGRENPIDFLIDHIATRNIGSTLGGSMQVWRDGLHLWFSIKDSDIWGTKMIAAIRADHRRKLSFGALPKSTRHAAPTTLPRVVITKATLLEISLVESGSMPTFLCGV